MTDDTMNLTWLVRIYPNAVTRKFIKRNIIFAQEVYNIGIKTWEHMYHQEKKYLVKIVFKPKEVGKKIVITQHNYYRKTALEKCTKRTLKDKDKNIIGYLFKPIKRSNVPGGRAVRDRIIDQLRRNNWLKPTYSKQVLFDTLIYDLDQAYQAFFDPERPDSKKPKIKHKITDNGSYLDTQATIKNGKIYLTASRKDPNYKNYQNGIRTSEDIASLNDDKRHHIRIIHRDGKFYAAISVARPIKHLMPTGLDDAVDANVDHFNSANYVVWLSKRRVYSKKKRKYRNDDKLERLYKKIAHYQRVLANKRECIKKHYKKLHKKVDKSKWVTKNYLKIQEKLRKAYLKVTNIQHDIVQKYTNYLVKYHDKITIEDLDVKHMKMGRASKGLQRSLFGYFKQVIKYKAKLFGRELVIADKFYPSTQACPRCGMAKAGDNKITLAGNEKHGTKHEQFICYYCGYKADRDVKVTPTLMRYNPDSMKRIHKDQRQGLDYQILGQAIKLYVSKKQMADLTKNILSNNLQKTS